MGLAVGLNPPSVYNRKTQALMQQSMIPGDSQECWEQEFHEHGENMHEKFLNGKKQSTDVLNELVAQ